MQLNPSFSAFLFKVALVIAFAFITAGAVIALFLADLKIIGILLGVLIGILGLGLSGNPRLFCLWGLILAAPLSLDMVFKPIAHMGGAASFAIELTDFFLAPLLLFLIRDFAKGHRTDLRLSYFTVFWVALIVLGLIDFAFGPFRTVVAHELFRMAKLLILFVVIINELVRVKQFKHVFAALMVGLAFQSAIGLAQYLTGAPLGLEFLGEESQAGVDYTSLATYLEESPIAGTAFTYRVGSLFGHPNLFSVYLAMLIPIALAMLFTKMALPSKIVVATVIFVGLVALVLTLSRSGWIAFALAFVSLLVLTFVHPTPRYKFLFVRFSMISGTALMGVALAGPIVKRIFRSDPGAVSFRWDYMKIAWDMILDKPVFGHGLNTFVFNMVPYTPEKSYIKLMDAFGEILPVVHNIYLLVWAEQGTIGFLIFMAMYFYLLKLSWSNFRYFRDEALYMINLGCLCALIGLAADGLASFFIRNGAPGRVFIIIAGLIVAIYYWNRDNSVNDTTKKPQGSGTA